MELSILTYEFAHCLFSAENLQLCLIFSFDTCMYIYINNLFDYLYKEKHYINIQLLVIYTKMYTLVEDKKSLIEMLFLENKVST